MTPDFQSFLLGGQYPSCWQRIVEFVDRSFKEFSNELAVLYHFPGVLPFVSDSRDFRASPIA